MKIVPSAAGAFLLLLAGCNQAPTTPSGNETLPSNGEDATADLNAAVSDENVAEITDAGTTAATDAPPVQIVEVPMPAATDSAAEAAPLTLASDTARRIRAGRGIDRVPYEGGWAWREQGKIIRTVSRDGRRVSYFRPGESAPYLVQDGDRSFAYSNGQLQRGYDRRGAAVDVGRDQRQQGADLARQAAREHDEATRAGRGGDQQGQRPASGDGRSDDRRSGDGRQDNPMDAPQARPPGQAQAPDRTTPRSRDDFKGEPGRNTRAPDRSAPSPRTKDDDRTTNQSDPRPPR